METNYQLHTEWTLLYPRYLNSSNTLFRKKYKIKVKPQKKIDIYQKKFNISCPIIV